MIVTSLAGNDIPIGNGEIAELDFIIQTSSQDCMQLNFGFVMASGEGTTSFSIEAHDFCADLTHIDNRYSTADNFHLSCYPNPFNHTLTILWMSQTTGSDIKIYNVRGERVFQKSNVAGGQSSFRWNTQGMSSGIYFVEVSNATGHQLFDVLLIK
jgi:hypothetical protein